MTDIITSENLLIGAAITNPQTARRLLEELKPEDFTVEANREIFEAMQRIDNRGEDVDPAKAANESGVVRSYFYELMEIAPSGNADLEPHIAEVRKAALRRGIREVLSAADTDIIANADPSEVIDGMTQQLAKLAEHAEGELISGENAALEFWDRLDSDAVSVQTGFEDLDRILGGGMLNCGLYVLAARPGCGKTAISLQIADNVAKQGGVLFISLEMDSVQLTARRVSRICKIPASKLLLGGATDDEIAAASRAGHSLINVPLYLNKTLRCGVSEIRTMARKVKNLRLVVIDYLQLIKPNMRLRSRYEQITEISGELKVLARTLGVPVLCLAQLNRGTESRADKKPMLSDLRDSGAIEQDADSVILLHRPDMYDEDEKAESVQVKVNVAKNRHAGTGEIDMMMHLASGKFSAADWRYS
ncbi:AAA family ATPase [Butyricicoccus sp. BIOML-A1]|nr:DnaB-like helicase C-terminal domain-containing protein [Butyricicoccus sp. BIOML-A1]MZT25648.1 AAA family ATPase [Butyricicoccus sp. BIOML-A1]DAS93387.1 MAG TPA: DnaB-like replicative helicase [Caudoviricetes sp.]